MLINVTRDAVLAERLLVADSFFARLRGLIGHAPLADDAALWIRPCQQVHTHFMRYALHVVFLDAEQRVLRVAQAMRPWRVSPWVRQARSVIEFNAGRRIEVAEGDRLRIVECFPGSGLSPG
ncbi:MAG: DUF192 domain-containing protein [Burkholderiales bacterium]|nr:DUF192 domain-containing protein [Burkholderiales bacterium]